MNRGVQEHPHGRHREGYQCTEGEVGGSQPTTAGASRTQRMSPWSTRFIRQLALVLALVTSGAPLHASDEVPGFDFSKRAKLSEAEADAEAIIRTAASKLCAAKDGDDDSRWAYKAFGAVRASCGSERPRPPPLDFNQRFEFWSGCLPMKFFVRVEGDAQEIGLTSESLKVAIESRLRAARLYTTENLDSALDSRVRGGGLYDFIATRSLLLDIRVLGPAFSSTLRFSKLLHDPASGTRGLANTWVDHVLGTHGRDGSYVLRTTSQLLDEFIARYLRVNESECQSR